MNRISRWFPQVPLLATVLYTNRHLSMPCQFPVEAVININPGAYQPRPGQTVTSCLLGACVGAFFAPKRNLAIFPTMVRQAASPTHSLSRIPQSLSLCLRLRCEIYLRPVLFPSFQLEVQQTAGRYSTSVTESGAIHFKIPPFQTRHFGSRWFPVDGLYPFERKGTRLFRGRGGC